MTAAIRISVDNVAVLASLDRAAAVLGNPPLAEIGARLVASTIDRFERERDPDGTPWLPSQRALAEHGQTLTDTGRLKASIAYLVLDREELLVGTNVTYAAIHQFGGQAGRAKKTTLPARPYLGIDSADGRAITRIVSRAIERALR